jgi:hypothetical protein
MATQAEYEARVAEWFAAYDSAIAAPITLDVSTVAFIAAVLQSSIVKLRAP